MLDGKGLICICFKGHSILSAVLKWGLENGVVYTCVHIIDFPEFFS